MWMHAEQTFCLFWNLLFKNPIKVFKVSSRNKILPDKLDKKLRFLKRVAYDHYEPFNSNDLTV